MSGVSAQASKRRRALKREPTIQREDFEATLEKVKQTDIPVEWFQTGELLARLADGYADIFESLDKTSRLIGLTGTHSWGLIGVGVLGAQFCMESIESAKRVREPSLELSQRFFADVDPAARAFADSILNAERRKKNLPLVCIFGSFVDLGQACGDCLAHGRKCLVPDVEFLVASSCSYITSNIGTGSRGLLNYLDSHSSVLLCVHAVTESFEDETARAPGHAELFEAEINSRLFEGQRMSLSARFFGTARNVKHFYSCFFKSGGSGSNAMDLSSRSLADAFQTLRCFTQACQCTAPSALDLLCADDDDIVERELVSRVSEGAPKSDGNWEEQHSKAYHRLRLSSSAAPLDARTVLSPWYGTLSQQQRSALIYRQHYAVCSKGPNEGDDASFPDVVDVFSLSSVEGVVAAKVDGRVVLPAVTPALWVHALPVQRLMLPEEHLLINGWPLRQPSVRVAVSSRPLSLKLALCMVPLPSLLVVLQSSLSCMSWRRVEQPPTSSTEDVAAAEALLQSLA